MHINISSFLCDAKSHLDRSRVSIWDLAIPFFSCVNSDYSMPDLTWIPPGLETPDCTPLHNAYNIITLAEKELMLSEKIVHLCNHQQLQVGPVQESQDLYHPGKTLPLPFCSGYFSTQRKNWKPISHFPSESWCCMAITKTENMQFYCRSDVLYNSNNIAFTLIFCMIDGLQFHDTTNRNLSSSSPPKFQKGMVCNPLLILVMIMLVSDQWQSCFSYEN